MESAKSRFLRYVTYYTTSDEFTGTSPSTERQKDLGRALMQELEALKLGDVHMDDCGNVLATLPASEGVDAPVIALIAHMDTAPDASGENVKPRLVRYEGGELKLNDTVSLTEALCPAWKAMWAKSSSSPTARRSSARTTRPASPRSWPRSRR